MFGIFIKQSIFILIFASSGYILGRAILRDFRFSSQIEDFGFNVITGWSVLALLMMFLGFWGLLLPVILFTVFAVILIASLFSIILGKRLECPRPVIPLRNPVHDNLTLVVFVFAIIYFILLFYISLYPITEWDAISYHLPVAKAFVSQARIVPIPFIRFPIYPQLVELFFSLALILNNPLFSNGIQYAMMLLLAILIYSFAQRYLGKWVGLFSASIFWSSPIILQFSLVPYVEINTALFCFSAFYAMYIWIAEGEFSYALLSAILWGLAFSSKYYSMPFFLVACIISMRGKKITLTQIILFLAISILIAFPWYLRIKIYSGDWFFPLWPITGIWRSEQVVSHLGHMYSFGMGRSLKSFLALPINLLWHNKQFEGTIGPLIIGIGSLFLLKKLPQLLKLIATVILVYILLWFFSFQILRYMFPIFPLLAILGGWTLQKILESLNLNKQLVRVFLIISVLLFGCITCIKIIKHNGPLPVTASQEFKYISRYIPTYKAINFLNNMKGNDRVVYALYDESSVFFHKNKVIGDGYGKAAYGTILPYLNRPILLHNILRNYGANYFLVNRKKVTVDINLFSPEIFKLIYVDSNAYIFEIL